MQELNKRGLEKEMQFLKHLNEKSQEKTPEYQYISNQDVTPPDGFIDVAADNFDFTGWLAVTQLNYFEHAETIFKMVKEAGMDCVLTLADDIPMVEDMEPWLHSIKLCIRESDKEAFDKAFKYNEPAELKYADGTEYPQPKCQKCSSLKIIHGPVRNQSDKLDQKSWTEFPHGHHWSCIDCGHQWQDAMLDYYWEENRTS